MPPTAAAIGAARSLTSASSGLSVLVCEMMTCSPSTTAALVSVSAIANAELNDRPRRSTLRKPTSTPTGAPTSAAAGSARTGTISATMLMPSEDVLGIRPVMVGSPVVNVASISVWICGRIACGSRLPLETIACPLWASMSMMLYRPGRARRNWPTVDCAISAFSVRTASVEAISVRTLMCSSSVRVTFAAMTSAIATSFSIVLSRLSWRL